MCGQEQARGLCASLRLHGRDLRAGTPQPPSAAPFHLGCQPSQHGGALGRPCVAATLFMGKNPLSEAFVFCFFLKSLGKAVNYTIM